MNLYTTYEKQYQQIKAKGWPGWGGAERIAKNHVLLDRLFANEHVPTSGRILELGCGEGNYSRLFAQRGFEVVGVEVSETAVAWAKEKSADFDIEYYARNLAQPNSIAALHLDPFDLVVDGNCFHCIIKEGRPNFLKTAFDAPMPGGIFFISAMCSKTDEDEFTESGLGLRHIASVRNILSDIEAVGFEILEHTVYENERFNHVTVHALRN